MTVSPEQDGTPVDGEKQPHPLYADRWADGSLRVGNTAAVKHGGYTAARARGEVPTDLSITITEFREGVIADKGGIDSLTTIERAYIQRLSDLEVMVRLVQNDLVNRGVVTSKGRVRSSFTKLLETFDRWDRFAQRIGIDRKARYIDPMEALRAAVDKANR